MVRTVGHPSYQPIKQTARWFWSEWQQNSWQSRSLRSDQPDTHTEDEGSDDKSRWASVWDGVNETLEK